MNSEPGSSCKPNRTLLAEFGTLWAEVDALWERHQAEPAFHGYVSADYQAVYDSLAQLQGRVTTVLEWGSGLGVVTIMASRMGFDAYGIESEASLVEFSEAFAVGFGPNAKFAQGSFVPDQFQRNPVTGDNVIRTLVDANSAYVDLDMELRDFDLIYSYPWPNERVLYHDILREFARPEAFFLCFDVRAGIQLVQIKDL